MASLRVSIPTSGAVAGPWEWGQWGYWVSLNTFPVVGGILTQCDPFRGVGNVNPRGEHQ